MRHQQSGFTLIELIMVISILGVLAASAIPRFIDLSSDAETAALQGVVGAYAAAAAINVASCAAGNTCITIASGTTPCTAFSGALAEGAAPAGYTVNGTAPTCSVQQTSTGSSSNFTGIPAS